MRVPQKLDLLEKIARELQRRYTFSEINDLVRGYGLEPIKNWEGPNSKALYAKACLAGANVALIATIAADLDLDPSGAIATASLGPRNWQRTTDLRLFISHISLHKDKATRLKDCLAPHGISGFVAHEDIYPTLEWQSEIERALYAMDAFLAMHTPGFSQSYWTQQEIGFAVARGVKIISLKMGEDPTGFISKRQALPRRNRTAEDVATDIGALLATDPLTSRKLSQAQAARQPKRGLTAFADDIPF